MQKYLSSILFAFLSFLSTATQAQEEGSDRAFGTWSGLVSKLEEKGITFEFIQTTDYVANVKGGIRRTSGVLGNTDLTFTANTEKAGLWSGGTFFLYGLGNYGRDPTTYVGDLQVANNIEAYDTAKIYEAWYNHQFLERKAAFLFGLHDYNSEFGALEYAGNLINSSFGISIDISQVGPSIFPTTSLAARLRVLPSEQSYIQSAVYDGVPGDPDRPRGTRVRFKDGDGIFSALEAGIIGKEEDYYKFAVGSWYLSSEFEDFNTRARDSNYGQYIIGEKKIFSEEQNANAGLGVFFQYGRALGDRNQIDQYVGAGFAYTGSIPCRTDDVLAFGYNKARNSDAFKNASEDVGNSEQIYELSYKAIVLPYLSVQPDLQYVVNPSTSYSVADALVLTLRTELVF